jgi:hypothetical protein
MNIAAYARHRGCSRQAVYKALETGRITRGPDGSIDPAKADAQWLANTSPAWTTGGEDVVLTKADLERLLG